MKTITIKDCDNLLKDFVEYTNNAETHEFPMLLLIDMKLRQTIENCKQKGYADQKELRAMFRVVLKTIGKDYSEYVESGADMREVNNG